MAPQPKRRPVRSKTATPFAANLKKLLADRQLSIRTMADIAGVKPSTLQNWLSGENPADILAVQKLARALQLDFEALLTGTSTKFDPQNVDLSQIFTEQPEPSFSGLFKIEAKRLVKKSGKD